MDGERLHQSCMPPSSESAEPLRWSELTGLAKAEPNRIEGPTNAQASLRLFGQPESSVMVTLYRDHHAWCPYCQKIWLWLEFKRIPYRIRKVTMRCYGPKEPWFLEKVALRNVAGPRSATGELITESDEILLALEQQFGPLGMAMTTPEALELRRLERLLFQAWCIWLCSPRLSPRQQTLARDQFQGDRPALRKRAESSGRTVSEGSRAANRGSDLRSLRGTNECLAGLLQGISAEG